VSKSKRAEALDLWLERVEASQCWEETVDEGTGPTVTGYIINSQLAVVVRYADRNGWELLVPASTKNSVAATLDGAAAALGVEGCRDLPGVK